MGAAAIRLLIVDDHLLVRRGIRALLAEVPDMQVVGEACNGREGVERADELRPDVILMDLMMPEMDGIQAIREITSRWREARILALTSFSGDDKVFPALKAGAVGYLLKDTDSSELVRAIRRVCRGEASLHPAIARKVLLEFHDRPAAAPELEPLTDRETEVLHLVAKGMGNKDIAANLCVSPATVRTHVSNILAKLHMANRVQATLYALRKGISRLEK